MIAGQTVRIHGGSGGVGSMAIQIAKARGAKVVATASTANQDLLKQLGVDQPMAAATNLVLQLFGGAMLIGVGRNLGARLTRRG